MNALAAMVIAAALSSSSDEAKKPEPAKKPIRVLIDINDSPDHSDDVSFVGKPMMVRITLIAPDEPGLVPIKIAVADAQNNISPKSVIVAHAEDTPDQGRSEITLQLRHQEAVRIYTIAIKASEVSGDVRVIAFGTTPPKKRQK